MALRPRSALLALGLSLGVGIAAFACGDDAAPQAGDGGSAGTDAAAPAPSAGPEGGADDAATVDAGDAGAPTAADPTGVVAFHAREFLGSIGVCTHVGQGVDDPTAAGTALAYGGFRGIRDDGAPAHVDDWLAIHRATGARLSLLTNRDVASTIDMAKKLAAGGALLAVEGPNEPNNFPVTYDGGTSSFTGSFMPVAELQRDLYLAVKAEPGLAGIPIFHASEAGGSEPDNVGLQFLAIPLDAGTTVPGGTAYADFANTHNYVCGHQKVLRDNMAWSAADPTLNDDWDGLFVEYGRTWHGGFAGYSDAALATLPRVTTETGWETTGDKSLTEEQQGRLLLDVYLAAFARGWSYTFVYMLRDDPVQGDWGFFDRTWQPKRSGVYIHALTTILSSGDAASGALLPHRLDYAIASPPATVHDVLLEKPGVFDLVVWGERAGGGSDAVTVDLKHARDQVDIYDPTVGTTPTMTLRGVSSVPLTVSDHPLVLEIR